jgi:general secretion pathway protein L
MNIKDILNSDMTTTGRWIRQGFDWWLDEILALVPPHWRTRFAKHPQLVVYWDERGFSSREGNAAKPFDASAYTSGELDNAAIVMPMRKVLTRELDLPLLPPNDLRRLVSLDIDRLAPFPADAIYFDTEILQRDAEHARQRVLLGVLPRATVADTLADADAKGIRATSLGAKDDVGSNTHFDFLGQVAGAGARRGARARLPYWWIAVAVFMAANIGFLVYRDSVDLDSLRDDVDSQAATVEVATHLRDKVEVEAARRADLLARLKHNAPLRVLDAVTKALPANAWAERVEWNGKTVQVTGYHEGPANLLQRFEASPILHNARILSANNKPQASGTSERFEIVADVRPAVRP